MIHKTCGQIILKIYQERTKRDYIEKIPAEHAKNQSDYSSDFEVFPFEFQNTQEKGMLTTISSSHRSCFLKRYNLYGRMNIRF